MSWKSDIKKALERCEVPVELHDQAITSFEQAKKLNKKTLYSNISAPFVTPFLLWNLPWLAEQLETKDNIYGNEACNNTGINGDRRAWLPKLRDYGEGNYELLTEVGEMLPSPISDTYPVPIETGEISDNGYRLIRLQQRPAEELVYYGYGWAKKLYKALGGKIHPRDNFCRYLFIGLRNRASNHPYSIGPVSQLPIRSFGNVLNSEREPGEGFHQMGEHWQYRSHKKKFNALGYTWFKRQNLGFKIDNVLWHGAARAMVVFTTFSLKGEKNT